MKLPVVLRLLLLFSLCVSVRAANNVLTEAEKSAGWQLLFDGHSFAGWRGYRMQGLPTAGWDIQDGTMHVLPKAAAGGKELITEKKFNDFELSWEWKISEAGN